MMVWQGCTEMTLLLVLRYCPMIFLRITTEKQNKYTQLSGRESTLESSILEAGMLISNRCDRYLDWKLSSPNFVQSRGATKILVSFGSDGTRGFY
jgi:hypothetical protein